MDMLRTSASRFKAKLGQFMRAVRAGKEVVVTDREQPVARLIPYERPAAAEGVPIAVSRDPTAPPLGRLEVKGIKYRGRSTAVMLQGDRRR